MKFTLLAISAAIASFVSAQTTVPPCAQNCVNTLLPASCNYNPECICKDTNFITNISCCVFNACPVSEQTNALNFARTICTPVGVTLPAQAGCSNSTSSSTTTSASASGSGSAVSSASSSAASAASTSRAAGEKLAANGMGLFGAVLGAVALL